MTLPDGFPDRFALARPIANATVVGATLYAVYGSASFAALVAGGTLALALSRGVAEGVVGDYAGNALLGAVALGFVGYVAVRGGPWWFLVALGLCGGWLVVDGVQHLRHDVSRTKYSSPYDGGLLTGLPRTLCGRLVEPFRL